MSCFSQKNILFSLSYYSNDRMTFWGVLLIEVSSNFCCWFCCFTTDFNHWANSITWFRLPGTKLILRIQKKKNENCYWLMMKSLKKNIPKRASSGNQSKAAYTAVYTISNAVSCFSSCFLCATIAVGLIINISRNSYVRRWACFTSLECGTHIQTAYEGGQNASYVKLDGRYYHPPNFLPYFL